MYPIEIEDEIQLAHAAKVHIQEDAITMNGLEGQQQIIGFIDSRHEVNARVSARRAVTKMQKLNTNNNQGIEKKKIPPEDDNEVFHRDELAVVEVAREQRKFEVLHDTSSLFGVVGNKPFR